MTLVEVEKMKVAYHRLKGRDFPQRDSCAIPFLKGWGAQHGSGIILEALLTSSFAITDQWALSMGQDSGDDVNLHIMSGEVLLWDAIVHAAGLEYP